MDIALRKAQITEFHTQFRNLIKIAPDDNTRRDLNVAMNRFRNRYSQTFDQKKAAIIALIESGLVTRADLENETGYPTQIVVNILKELTKDKKIQAVIYPMSGRGRPTKKYFLID